MHKRQQPAPQRATLVVVADAGRARLFSPAHEDGALIETADWLNAPARQQDHDAVSDRRGHVVQGSAGVGHTFEPRQTRAEHDAQAFAKRIGAHLDAACRSGDVERVYLVADPAFLGLLRQALDPATRRHVVLDLSADLTRRSAADIRAALPETL
jgi:protein required for attachment to host cells